MVQSFRQRDVGTAGVVRRLKYEVEFSPQVDLAFTRHCWRLTVEIQKMRAAGFSERKIRWWFYQNCWYK